MKDTLFSTKNTLSIRGKIIDISTPKVMGIINVSPDSFYAGSRMKDVDEVLTAAEKMMEEGATFLDIGGYSSRPGAYDVGEEDEILRVVPAVEAVVESFPEAIVSVDSFRSSVALSACEAGAGIINDISGGEHNAKIFEVAAQQEVPYILMHMRGTPSTMNKHTDYKNIVVEIMEFLREKVLLLQKRGVRDIIVDPGFGFAKTIDQNYVLLKNLGYFTALELPLLVGLSRKSMIHKKLEVQPDQALNGTTVLNTLALNQGARILRVHDVKEAVEAVILYNSFEGAEH